ncbi:MAG: post-PEP-CTERM-1 domain-containing protein, partial [Candidatus Eiseniibacteriota bacterium]
VWIRAATRGGSHAPTHEPTAVIEALAIVPAPLAPVTGADARGSADRPAAGRGSTPPIVSRGTSPSAIGSPAGAAMRIARDPATGQIVAPEPAGAVLTVEAMQALVRLEVEGLVTIHNPDGSETLNHEGRFVDYTVLRIGPDGRRVFQCAHGPFVGDQPLRGAAPLTPTMEDR